MIMIYLSHKIINEIPQYQKEHVILDMAKMIMNRCMCVKGSIVLELTYMGVYVSSYSN